MRKLNQVDASAPSLLETFDANVASQANNSSKFAAMAGQRQRVASRQRQREKQRSKSTGGDEEGGHAGGELAILRGRTDTPTGGCAYSPAR